MNKEELNHLSKIILDSAIEVHRTLGPGLFESIYEVCMIKELTSRGLQVASQVELPVIYKGERLPKGYRLDLLVENEIIIEIKTISAFTTIHEAQILTYLKLSKKNLGLLINFNVTILKYGFNRYVNNFDH